MGIYSQRIYARKCTIKEINSKTYIDFCYNNHIQGPARASVKLGLEYNGELLAIMSFGNSRFKKDETELIRYCSKLNTQVIGGFSKLIKHFNKSFITYCDLRYSNGSGYLKNGFILVEQTKPNY